MMGKRETRETCPVSTDEVMAEAHKQNREITTDEAKKIAGLAKCLVIAKNKMNVH